MPFPDSSMARIGRFSQIRSLGEGASGQVYYAQDNLGRAVAVVDVRTDLYALGISLWESLTCTSYKALLAQSGTPNLRAFCPHCNDDTAAIIQRATQTDPALRYQTAQAMASDLRDVLEGRPLRASETQLWSGVYTMPRTSAPQPIGPHPSSGSPRLIRRPPRLAVVLLVALLGITAVGLALASRVWPAGPPGGVNTAALPVASASPGPSVPCRFNNLMDCSELVPVYQPGNSEATATRYDTGEVRVTFRNQSAGSGLALQFAPNLDVSGFTRVELVATADQPFAFLVEYKAGTALEIVQVSPQRRFGQGTNIIEVPITYDGAISELVFNFVTRGEVANFTIESLRLR